MTELHFPLEVGDVFAFQKFHDRPHGFEQKQGRRGSARAASDNEPAQALRRQNTVQHMILLAQPCDIAVRADGKRGNGLEFVRVAPLRPPTGGRLISQPGGGVATSFDLPFFFEESGGGVEVKLSRQQYVPLVALDMCVLSESGEGSLSVTQSLPPHLLPNWQERFRLLLAWVTKQVIAYKAMEPHRIPGKGAGITSRLLLLPQSLPRISIRSFQSRRRLFTMV